MDSYIKKYGIELFRLGYNVVPIPAGSKACKLIGWPNIVADEQMIESWFGRWDGCGIRGPHTVGIDLDIYDQELVQEMLAFVHRNLGYSPHRVGMPPKALLPYRCDVPFEKLKSAEFESFDGSKNMLEILANGQQFVTAHIHPQTEEPYAWHYADGAINETLILPWNDLPLIKEEDAHMIIAVFESHCEQRGWKRKEKISSKRIVNSSQITNYSSDEIREMLSYLDPNMPYDDWLRVGMALHSGGYAIDLWGEWSKGSDKYKQGECASKWDSFKIGGDAC